MTHQVQRQMNPPDHPVQGQPRLVWAIRILFCPLIPLSRIFKKFRKLILELILELNNKIIVSNSSLEISF